jgi:hypothetical protein
VFYARVGVIVEPGLNLTFYIRGQLTEGVARYL